MIIKSSQRWGTKQLADHLTNSEENEHIHFSDCRGIFADTVHDALDDMEDLSHRSTRCQKHLYHVSISPDRRMNKKEWAEVWQTYEAEFCLEDRPYIEVTHTKGGRIHKHRVYERVGDDGRAVPLSYTYQRNEKVARILEYKMGQPLTVGKHNRIVMRQLLADGYQEVVDWMESQNAHAQTRPVAISNHTDYQQQKRTGMTVQQVKDDLQAAYQMSDNGKTFEAAIAEKGYILARGDRRKIVVLDRCGGIHSPRRRLDVKAAEIRAKWADLSPDHLPKVVEVKQQRKEKPVTVNPILSQQDRTAVETNKALLQNQDEKQRKQKQLKQHSEQIAKASGDVLPQFHAQNSEVFQHITDGDRDR